MVMSKQTDFNVFLPKQQPSHPVKFKLLGRLRKLPFLIAVSIIHLILFPVRLIVSYCAAWERFSSKGQLI